MWGNRCIFAPTNFVSSYVSREDKGVGQNTSYVNFLPWILCKEVSLSLFAVYRKSKGGCEVGPTSTQYTSAAAHLFGWRTYHPSWHWCCLYIVAAVSVCSRRKLQVSSLLLIEACHHNFYITRFLCYCSTFTNDQNLRVVRYSFCVCSKTFETCWRSNCGRTKVLCNNLVLVPCDGTPSCAFCALYTC